MSVHFKVLRVEAVESFNGPLCFAAESDYGLFEFAWHFPGGKELGCGNFGQVEFDFLSYRASEP